MKEYIFSNKSFGIIIFLIQINIIKYLILLSLFKKIKNNCEIETPIYSLNENKCVSKYCTDDEFKSGECTIDNEIIKIQWFNNIIWIGDNTFRFVNFATYSNEDIIIETTSSPGNSKRMFYGLAQNGRIFFTKNNSYNFSLEATNQIGNEGNIRSEAEIFIAKINNNDNEEYLVSIGKSNQYIELYDFEENKIYQLSINDFLEQEIENIGTSLNYILDNNNVLLLGFLSSITGGYSFNLNLLNFTSKDIEYINPEIIKSESIDFVYGKEISCFITELKYIICFYLIKNSNNKYIPHMTVFNQYLENLRTDNFNYANINIDTIFFKCIHLLDETGVFIFYSLEYYSNKNAYLYVPIIEFKKYDYENTIFVDYFTDENVNLLYLDSLDFYDSNYLLNDFIKVSYHKLCLISTSLDKKQLFITNINIFGENNAIIRYYYMDFFLLFKYKIFLDIKGSLYKNFISFAFSFCRDENCENENDNHNSAFLIFSYSNSTDYELNIEKYLFKYNEIKIDNISIDLNENITLENNLFGNVFTGIRIDNIINCQNINLMSVEKNSLITINYMLEQNEKIKLIFINNEYKAINCRINYVYIVTDPDFEDVNNYPEMKDPYHGGEETKEKYNSQKELYIGRTSYYDIILENDLRTNCKNKNCELCLNLNINYCITCNSSFTIIEKDGINNKICEGGEEDTDNVNENQSDSNQDSDIPSINQNEENDSYKNNNEYDDETNSEEGIFLDTDWNKEENIDKSNTIKELDDKSCTIEQIINNLCLEGILSSEEILKILNLLKNDLFNNFNNDENRIILTKNVVFQVSTLEQQKNSNNSNISSIDFGECENILKYEYKISSDEELKIIKIDIKNQDLSKTYVQNELYSNISTDRLNLNKCENTTIILNIPNNLEPDIISLYDSLKKAGYNLFDYNDSFYNDICSPYTTENKTDILLNDRQKDIFSKTENITLCQDNCILNSFNIENSKAKCECNIQKKSIQTNISTINFDNNFDNKKFVISFWNTIKNANFLVLKCYKLALNMKNFLKNYGRIIMTILLVIYIFFLIIYIFKERKKINIDIQSIMKNDFNFCQNSDKKILNINELDKSDIKNPPPKSSKFNIEEKDKNKNKIKILNGIINSRNELMNISEGTNKIIVKKYKRKKKEQKINQK